MRDPRSIIRRIHFTEKGNKQNEKHNQFLFEVSMDANKIEIKRAVEEIFDVNVTGVRTLVRRGKNKRYGRFEGKRANWKRAIVTLAEGQEIPIFDHA